MGGAGKSMSDNANKGCQTDIKRVCNSVSDCSYSGDRLNGMTRKCLAYEISGGTVTRCGGLLSCEAVIPGEE